ncbi:type I-E CRISPR-associated protein Cse2/CasB [Streptomyces sp. NPDC004647]|uniref:type I-E CRISPR-associated protein Cse2/CasB n=1 Tax=Streptomyces sp. NPDC004647 TaxID=3154671 RepID=UPI00339DA943
MTTDSQERAESSSSDRAARPPAEQLTGWLADLVRTRQYGVLADLRRPAALTQSRLLAENFAPAEEHRVVYGKVAFFFARYHAGASDPHYGFGSLGAALRRVGSPAGRGPKDAGATRLLDRVVACRAIPWRHLQHAVERSRSCGTHPPSWAQLTEDLVRWSERGRPVPYGWARDFYTPVYKNRNDA